MLVNAWPDPFNQLLYTLIFSRSVSEEDAQRIADNIVDYRSFGAGPAAYHEALTQALDEGWLVGPHTVEVPLLDEATLREFFGWLHRALEERRPWPERRFIRLSAQDWPGFAAVAPSFRLRRTLVDLHGPTGHLFTTESVDGVDAPVLLLRQRTGEVVALIGSYSKDIRERRLVRFIVLDGDPEKALASFRELSGLGDQLLLAP